MEGGEWMTGRCGGGDDGDAWKKTSAAVNPGRASARRGGRARGLQSLPLEPDRTRILTYHLTDADCRLVPLTFPHLGLSSVKWG